MGVSMGEPRSGRYYLAMAVGDQQKSIYAEDNDPGSIGVIVPGPT
jgi:hypothetical protein